MWLIRVAFVGALAASVCAAGTALDTYRALTRFELTGGAVTADHVRLVRDRVEMEFTGTFYLEAPVSGAVRGAVFIGQGTLRAEPSPVAFERDNVRRFLHADTVESNFKTAVLRFSDGTGEQLKALAVSQAAVPDEARELSAGHAKRLLREGGLNLDARVASSILNQEQPGIFAATFDKGKLSRFSYVLDPQARIPASVFALNAGEKGILFSYRDTVIGNDIWMAFPCMDDLRPGQGKLAGEYDQVSTRHYTMDIDLREANKRTLKLDVTMRGEVLARPVRAISFALNDNLEEFRSIRLKRALRVQSATLNGKAPVEFIQEDWEQGLTLLLPEELAPGAAYELEIKLEGDFLLKSDDEEALADYWGNRDPDALGDKVIPGLQYPRVNEGWYPRHGFLQPATFETVFHHRKGTLVVASGQRISEQQAGAEITTRFKMDSPVSFVTFAAGEFDRQSIPGSRAGTSIEFYARSGFLGKNEQTYMLTELENSVAFYSRQFGQYPWKTLAGVFHPRPFGQGFPTILLLAPTHHQTDKKEFSFIAHEAAHQWWGGMVHWRTYRDQWLSEGFAEYSASLYVRTRMNADAQRDLIRAMRKQLVLPPQADHGIGKGRVADLGPIVAGIRLATRESGNAYPILVYSKGALVLRMIHFLLADPATGQDAAFYEMMRDFVRRYSGKAASTEDFRSVAAEHFVRSPIARKYGLQDLNWFFRQWVYESALPTYRVNYRIDGQPDGSAVVRGAVTQENAGENWFMPIPIVFRFGKDQIAKGTINARGARNEFSIKLPAKPDEVQIDPDQWVLSEDTSAILER